MILVCISTKNYVFRAEDILKGIRETGQGTVTEFPVFFFFTEPDCKTIIFFAGLFVLR